MIRVNNKVALYARFSSDNQRSESIDAQIRAMKAYCKQHNFVIVDTYIDEAKSATTDRRPAFQQMIADSSNHTFDILLVHKLDRFARNRYDSAVYKRELKKNGVLVYSVLAQQRQYFYLFFKNSSISTAVFDFSLVLSFFMLCF